MVYRCCEKTDPKRCLTVVAADERVLIVGFLGLGDSPAALHFCRAAILESLAAERGREAAILAQLSLMETLCQQKSLYAQCW